MYISKIMVERLFQKIELVYPIAVIKGWEKEECQLQANIRAVMRVKRCSLHKDG